MLTSALDHYRRQQRITAAGVLAARRARAQGPLAVARIVAAFQLLAARDALNSIGPMLAEQGIPDEPLASVAVASVAGVASDGRSLDTLFEQAPNSFTTSLMAATQIQDAARGAGSLGIATRPNITGYARMLNPPSCSRCAVLAGKFYRWNDGFQRHPRCDCRHIPAIESTWGDLTTNPNTYFDSLSASEQDRIFTKAGAQAVRDGADVSQVVNARLGMSPAQIGGRDVLVTTSGTTVRGLAGTRLGDPVKVAGQRYRRSSKPRVMPETIYRYADSREDALRLLKLNGFIF